MRSVILHGPQGCGKSTIAASLARRLGLATVMHEWDGVAPLPRNALVLTSCPVTPATTPAGVASMPFVDALRLL